LSFRKALRPPQFCAVFANSHYALFPLFPELLQRHQYLEQQQVCDMALLPARETRERLYKLFL
jgi:hypothetical protein